MHCEFCPLCLKPSSITCRVDIMWYQASWHSQNCLRVEKLVSVSVSQAAVLTDFFFFIITNSLKKKKTSNGPKSLHIPTGTLCTAHIFIFVESPVKLSLKYQILSFLFWKKKKMLVLTWRCLVCPHQSSVSKSRKVTCDHAASYKC